MTSLSTEQKQLLLDYCIGLTSEEETTKAEALISSNQEAAAIHSRLKSALAPLDSLELEPCPDSLAQATIQQLSNLARSGQIQLEHLLAAEQSRTVGIRNHFWLKLGKVVAAAAVILIVLGIWSAPLQLARAKYQQHQCRMQFARIFDGIRQYSADYDGEMPEVARAEGAPWWKVAYPGEENHSNTRCVWLLVKGGYVKPANFVCPSRRLGQALQFATLQVEKYNDFPAREYITYSFQIRCPSTGNKAICRTIMADLNPLSERLPKDYNESLRLRIDEDLLKLNSINHDRRGQNVLFSDGSAKFIKVRRIGIAQDDIYTLQNMFSGCELRGCEVPDCESDAFLAP
jgi:hypothetical protein